MNRRELLGTAAATAAPWVLGAPAGRGRGEWLGLVTADREAHVAVVSLAQARVRQRVRTREDPRSVQAGPGGAILVGHTSQGVVTLLEGRPLRVRRVLDGFGEPRYGAVEPTGRYGFFTDSGHGELAVIDMRSGRVVRRVQVGALARHMTLDPAGRTLWVGLGSAAAAIAVVDVRDPLNPRRVRLVHPPFAAHDVGFSPSGRRVWVTSGTEPRIAIYAAGGQGPLAVQSADPAPQHVTFGPSMAYVASGEGRSVRAHSLRDGTVLRITRVPLGSYNIQRGGGRVLTPSLATGALTILDRYGRTVTEVHVAQAAHDACVV